MSQFASQPESAQETQPEPPAQRREGLSLSADDFTALEERVLSAVEVVKRERAARAAAEERIAATEEQLRQSASSGEQLRKEIETLRAERDQVRQRIERLLNQLDALNL